MFMLTAHPACFHSPFVKIIGVIYLGGYTVIQPSTGIRCPMSPFSPLKTQGRGDDIFGESPGCLRRYNCAKASLLSPKPLSWSFEEARLSQGGCGCLRCMNDFHMTWEFSDSQNHIVCDNFESILLNQLFPCWSLKKMMNFKVLS